MGRLRERRNGDNGACGRLSLSHLHEGDPPKPSSRVAITSVLAGLLACGLLAVTLRGSASPTTLTGWLATGKAGEPKFYIPPAEAAAQGGVSSESSDPFHSNGENVGTGSAARALDGKNVGNEMPKYLMQPKWAAREGREAAGHALAQPFLVPLESGGAPVLSAETTPLGEYAPVTPQYTNPLAQFIPNVTYVEDGDKVVGFEGPDDVAEESAAEEAAEEPQTAAEKQLNLMRSELQQVKQTKDGIKNLEARLAREQARLAVVQHGSMAQRIRQKTAAHQILQAGQRQTISPVYAQAAATISPVPVWNGV